MARLLETQTESPQTRLGLRALLGFVLLTLGLVYIALGFYWPNTTTRYELLGEDMTLPPWLQKLNPRFSVIGVKHFEISREGHHAPIRLDALAYRNKSGQTRSASFLTAIDKNDDNHLRQEIWQEAATVIEKNALPGALFISWWDNAQRLHFLNGVDTWVSGPDVAAFPDSETRQFWSPASGGFRPGENNRQLAQWLVMDADQAQAEMARNLPKDRPVYLLVTLDDLARLSELEALAKTSLPIEHRIFPASANLHEQIATVRRWATEKGTGSYLVQQLPQGGVRAWRITTEAGTRSLLARLLPFTSSLLKPLEHHKLIYQSRWGAYLSIYQWRP